jgi:2-keto-4-pentenoate hydratase/2-oxohepta-3-ene-1,7-dioic acid hydratase in catechol pathway
MGWVLGEYIGAIEGDIFGEYRRLEADVELARAQLFAPILPGKIIEVGRNYIDQVQEQETKIPEIPIISLKPPSAVIGHGEPIVIPQQSSQVEHEVELAVVIGKKGKFIPSDQAARYILGYTIANDVTARDLQRLDVHKTRSKSFDTFCPLGPWIETELDPMDVLVTCRVNGELRQMASTREMIFSVPQIIAFVSSVMTLFPGDVILTGTPAGSGVLQAGERVECSIEGIGSLENPVKQG